MAMFNGTIEEYHKYIGPRIRNRINVYTKEERMKQKGICQLCGNKAELESAHIKGKDRKTLIETVLEKYKKDETVLIDLGNIEEEIIKEHIPINEVFLFLCPNCHRKYDNENINNNTIINNDKENNIFYDSTDNIKIGKYEIPMKNTDKLQEYIQKILKILFKYKLIPENEIIKLKTKEYTKQYFKINYPLLINKNENIKDDYGHNRYWVKYILDNKYRVCSQWWKDFETDNYEGLQNWLKHLQKINTI